MMTKNLLLFFCLATLATQSLAWPWGRPWPWFRPPQPQPPPSTPTPPGTPTVPTPPSIPKPPSTPTPPATPTPPGTPSPQVDPKLQKCLADIRPALPCFQQVFSGSPSADCCTSLTQLSQDCANTALAIRFSNPVFLGMLKQKCSGGTPPSPPTKA